MSWWGKVVGGTFGFMLGGPLGAALGAAFGHQFDKGIKNLDSDPVKLGDRERVQTAFFTATFSVMGYIAKADGHVSKSEISLAEEVMRQMKLLPEQRKVAIGLFNSGKQGDFPVNDAVDQLRRECFHRTTLIRMFLEIQIQAALADGRMDGSEHRALLDIAGRLGFSPSHVDEILRFITGSTGSGQGRSKQAEIQQAYEVLGVSAESSDADIKKVYRRLMSQHHPDKLVAKGLPEEMIEVATEKTKKISTAYDLIKEFRKS